MQELSIINQRTIESAAVVSARGLLQSAEPEDKGNSLTGDICITMAPVGRRISNSRTASKRDSYWLVYQYLVLSINSIM